MPQCGHYLDIVRPDLMALRGDGVPLRIQNSLFKDLPLCVRSHSSPPLRPLLSRSLLARKLPKIPLATPLIRLLPTLMQLLTKQPTRWPKAPTQWLKALKKLLPKLKQLSKAKPKLKLRLTNSALHFV